MAEEYELGTVGPIPTVNPNVAKIGEMLKIAKKYADQYYVKENIPLIGGMTLGETLLGKAPEEVERWGQGDYPFRNPATVVGTGGNRLDIYKTGRFEPTFDVLANVALPIAGAAKYTKGLPVGGTIQDVSKITPTLAEYEAMVSKGKMHQARTFDQDLRDTLKGKVPGNIFEIPMARNVDYESGRFTKRLEKAGLHVYDDKFGTVYVGKTPQDLKIIRNAENPIEHGTSYGYAPEDIAKFYTNRRGGRSDIGYAEYLDDLINVQKKYPEIKDVSKVSLTAKEVEIIASKVDELGFYSPLENAILKIQQPKGTGDQFLKQLEKTPGVKTEELEVTGIKQYLLDHPTVTKQELLDQMDTNRLKLQQTVLDQKSVGDVDDYRLLGGDRYHDQDYIDSLANDLHYDMKSDDVIRAQEREALLKADPERYEGYPTAPYAQARLEDDIDNVLYEQAKLQSHEMYYDNPITHHYDELGYDIYGNRDNGYSIKDPQGNFLDLGGRNGIYDIDEAESALRNYHVEQGNLDYGAGGAKFEDYTLLGNYENYREVLTTLPKVSEYDKAVANMEAFKKTVNERLGKPRGGWDYEELTPQEQMKYDILNERGLRASKDKTNYESSHFDEPNILAHTRLNDRIINGKKTLFVEEIQSDWHQAGRKKGYATPISEERKMEIRLELDKLNDMKSYVRSQRDAAKAEGLSTINEDKRLADIERQDIELRSELSPKGVPDAPYKKNWHELMMKQILNEAVKGDYEAVAFTTGKQQAARYSLSKQISKVNFSEGGVLRAYDKNGNMVISKKLDSPDQIEDYIGKEPAKKLMEQEVKPTFIGEKESGEKIAHGNPNVFDARELSGVDLDVGGEGMKKFYDEILPNFVNKYGKKYGMVVKKEHLSAGDNNYHDFREWVIKQDPSLHESYIKDLWERKGDVFQDYRNAPDRKGDEVHFFDLSDMAKKDIKEKGQPLFSGIGLAPAPLLMDYEDN